MDIDLGRIDENSVVLVDGLKYLVVGWTGDGQCLIVLPYKWATSGNRQKSGQYDLIDSEDITGVISY